MGITDHNRRARVNTPQQHLLRHSINDFAYINPALPGVSTLEGAFDYLVAVLYPNSKTNVANPAALPGAGNTLNDMRVVDDDGDGKAASYRWEQREGDVAAKWYKIYDIDWGVDSILTGFLIKTQDIYVKSQGYDDLDDTGTALVGVNAGQHIFGGATASTNLTLHANSGDGVGAQTGYVQVADNFRPQVDSTWSCGTTDERWLKVWTDALTVSTMTITGGSILDSSGAITFGDENLTTTGNISGAIVTGSTSGVFAGDITITSGTIVSASGTISFNDEALTTTGQLTAQGGGRFGAANDMVINVGSITSVSGAISFGDENLSTTGTLGAGVATFSQLNVDNLRLDGNTFTSTDVDGNITISPNGNGTVILTKAATTLGITATGIVGVTGSITVDNLSFDGNTVSSTNVNGNVIVDPNGTGLIELGAAYFPTTDSAWDIGKTGSRWNDLWLDGSIQDGTTSITSTTLQSFRDANTGIADGMALFWNAAGSKWLPSLPDTEVDHGSLSGLGDDDHSQYLLLAGRSGGQSIIGGTDANDDLVLGSTSDGTKGFVLTSDDFHPVVTSTYSGGWAGTDIGSSSKKFRHIYTAGEFFGFRAENLGADPGASVQSVGRLFWHTGEGSLKVDTGTAIQKIGSFRYEEDTVWDGSTALKNVTVSGIDATKAIWQLKNNTNDFETMFVSVKATTTTNVRITTNIDLPAGTYRLVGIQ